MLVFEKGALAGLVRLEFAAMDAWFEEEVEVFVHPKDPFKRVEVLSSGRGVRVEVAGRVVADSGRAVLLFETGLPVRYYLPKTAVSLSWFCVGWGGLVWEGERGLRCEGGAVGPVGVPESQRDDV